ncbi:hypothetical protein FPSE_07369 [Fusarium pseudograminearum CS3096]|uniref:Arrestin-like N-terminal domain-containing protein n=1 Tax=Fusarium pseudograminearum (strain CS3096) TaxID=1028729 RepID=K3VHG7_FUSPC|nr:hypothetical protein FPSE_07369 [Fusarium pseudograminearum CS3096]EKJ72488.1 hypothetical protein FPSE_07369 [Fusarium pseudograminearum CS3096]
MQPLTTKSSPWLGIHLDRNTYAPGDTITGFVHRTTPIITIDAEVTCCLHGRASIVSGLDTRLNSKFNLLTCNERPDEIYRGPLYSLNNMVERWPFSLKIPTCADSTTNTGSTLASYMPTGAMDHQLPPTYSLYSTGVIGVFVEYFVSAKILFYEYDGVKRVQAWHPFKLVQYSPNPPIADFAVRVWRYPGSVRSTRLIPGRQDERGSLFSWAKRSSSRPGDPTLKFELLFGFPTRIQLDNQTPIPLRLAVFPNWDKTSEIIKNVPQKFRLLLIKVSLVTCTKVMTRHGTEKYYTKAVNLGVSNAIDNLQDEIQIPCTSSWEPIDVGKMIDLRITSKWITCGWKEEQFTPSFRTYNMTVTHKLRWDIEFKVAGDTLFVKGEANVLLLRSCDEREQSNRGLGLSEVEEDDSWIRPPPEDEAPPSFADAIVMGRRIDSQET